MSETSGTTLRLNVAPTHADADDFPKPPRMGWPAFFTFCAVIATTVVYYIAFGWMTFQPKSFQFDLVPFYCGAVTIASHADPYRVEPLRTCEHDVVAVSARNRPAAVPAPQPPYVLVAITLFRAIPFGTLRLVWLILQIAAFVATAQSLARLCRLSPWLVWAALGVADLYCSIVLGQLVVFCLFGIAIVGSGLALRSSWSVGCGLFFAALEPHIALGLFLSILAFGRPVDRIVTLCVSASLLAASLIAAPVAVSIEYLTEVLPLHALSEVNNQDQLSATYFLHLLGLNPNAALAIAKIQFACMLFLSIVVSRYAAKRFGIAMLAFAPPAFAVIGGPFLHVTQVCVAIPAALALYGASPHSRVRLSALMLLAVPWINFETVLTVLPLVSVSLAALLRWGGGLSASVTWISVGVATLIDAIVSFRVSLENITAYPQYGSVASTDFAEKTWKTIMDLKQHSHSIAANLAKIPTDAALIIIIVTLTAAVVTDRLPARQKSEGAAAIAIV